MAPSQTKKSSSPSIASPKLKLKLKLKPTPTPKTPPPSPHVPHAPSWAEVDVRGLRVERVRDFGAVYLALTLWRRLGLHTILEELIPRGREAVAWPIVACILTIARFCGNKSELEVAERWYQDSALERPPRSPLETSLRQPPLPRA